MSPLIYGDFSTNQVAIGKTAPAANLDVKGKTATDSLRIAGPTTPLVGSVLVSRDASGNAKWAGPINFKGTFVPSTPIVVTTAIISNIGNTAGGYTSQTILNNGPAGGLTFNATGMRYTVPEDGVYFLSAKILVTIASSGNFIGLEIFNQTTTTILERTMQSNPDATLGLNTVLSVETMAQLQKNQVIILRVNGSAASSGSITNAFTPTDKMSTFQGFLVR